MKKFLLNLLCFGAVLYLVALSIDIWVSKRLQKLESSPFANWNDIYSSNLESDVLIMGSSRAYVQFNPRIIDSMLHVNSYNLGSNGRPADAQILKYNIYRKEGNAKPKLIIYEIYSGTLDTSNGYDRIQYIPHLKRPYLWVKTRKMEHFSWTDCFIPCYRFLNYKQDIANILQKKSYYTRPENRLYKGFQDFDKKWDGQAYREIDSIDYKCNPQTLKLFEQFLDDCRAENIPVILVNAPFYIGATQKIRKREEMEHLFTQLATKHGARYLDYSQHPLCYDTCYFYNATHLNRKGTTIFSLQLAHDIDSISK